MKLFRLCINLCSFDMDCSEPCVNVCHVIVSAIGAVACIMLVNFRKFRLVWELCYDNIT